MTKLLAFEGIDASGKTMQHSLLRKFLEGRGLTVAEKSFPEYDGFFGSHIAGLLRGDDTRADEIDAGSMCLWFALDRWNSFKGGIPDCDCLLINRYVLSNAVYQSIRDIDSKDMLDWVLELEHGQLGLPMPHAYIVLDVPPVAAGANMTARGGRSYTPQARDVYEQSEAMQARARAKYLEYASRLNNIIIINCCGDGASMLPPTSIHQAIINELSERGLI